MPVPALITDLSTNEAANSPPGGETLGGSMDDYLRAAFAFIAQLRDGRAALTGAAFTGAVSFAAAVTITRASAVAVALRSGNAANWVSMTLGRTADEAALGICANVNDFITGTAAGDLALNNAAGKIHIASGNGPGIAVSTSNNVGFGLAPAANYRLDVNGTIRSIGGETSSGYGFRVLNAAQNGGGSLTAGTGVNAGVNLSADSGPLLLTAGGTDSAQITTAGHITPERTSGTQDFGSSAKRWATMWGAGLDIENGNSGDGFGTGENFLRITNTSNSGWAGIGFYLDPWRRSALIEFDAPMRLAAS